MSNTAETNTLTNISADTYRDLEQTRKNLSWTVAVPMQKEWDVPLQQNYMPIVYVDLYLGPTEAEIAKLVDEGQPGIVQFYEDHNLFSKQADISNCFMRLENVTSIKARQTINVSGGGQLNISLQNSLEEQKAINSTLSTTLRKLAELGRATTPEESFRQTPWGRHYYKSGRFEDGSIIRYLDSRDSKWYRGRLIGQKTSWFTNPMDEQHVPSLLKRDIGQVVTLDDNHFSITWIDERPPDNLGVLKPDRFFVEDLGKPTIEPMMKVKVYVQNRFTTKVLKANGYKTSLLVSQEEEFVEAVTEEPEYGYSCIFTGYVSSINHQRSGPTYTMDIVASDVMCWLKYSAVNVNPSLNIFRIDIDPYSQFGRANTEATIRAEQGDWQLFTSRFAGMPADAIIRTLFLGMRKARVNPDPDYTGVLLYNTPELIKDDFVLDSAGEPIIITPGMNLIIQDQFPVESVNSIPNAYCVMYSPEILIFQLPKPFRGWVNADYITIESGNWGGIGSFVEDTNSSLQITPEILLKLDLIKDFSSDKLLIYPAIEDPTQDEKDQYSAIAYRAFVRNNIPLVQSTYKDRRSIAKEVTDISYTNCYADGDGKVWFHPVWAYKDVKSPVYVIQPSEVQSWSIEFSDGQIVTGVMASGQTDFQIISPELASGSALARKELIRQFGLRIMQVSNSNVVTGPDATEFARTVMDRINADAYSGSVTITMRPELHLARNVFLPWLNLVGYISGIDNRIDIGKSAMTTIGLKYVRHPWEPWVPIMFRSTTKGIFVSGTTTKGDTTSTTTGLSDSSTEEAPAPRGRSDRDPFVLPSNVDFGVLERDSTKRTVQLSAAEMKSYVTSLVGQLNKTSNESNIKIPKLTCVQQASKAKFSDKHPYRDKYAWDIVIDPSVTFNSEQDRQNTWNLVAHRIQQSGYFTYNQYILYRCYDGSILNSFYGRYGNPVGNDNVDRITIVKR